MNYDERGELVGHISIGLELVNALWRKLSADNAQTWKDLLPAPEDVRLHLLHLIGAHHGEMEFGSPVAPKTPEAMALHYIDNLDARLEMFAAGYTTAKPLAARIFRSRSPAPGKSGEIARQISAALERLEARRPTLVNGASHGPAFLSGPVWASYNRELLLLQRAEPAQGNGRLRVIDFMAATEDSDSNSLETRSFD